MTISPYIFEAYLKCPTKCWLRSTGETGTGNAYADWVSAQTESYCAEGTRRLRDGFAPHECALSFSEPRRLKNAKWRLAVNVTLRARTLESRLHAVERVPPEERGKQARFVPVRFVFTNKLTQDHKLLTAFDAVVLWETLGREIIHGKIIHGDDHAALKVRTSALAGRVRKLTTRIANLITHNSPPDPVLNQHCPECEFQERCRKKAIEKDDLSLLASLKDKERARLNGKGIFTINQLSYTFRPRRRAKRLAVRPEKYHHALKALAIRERKIYIVGNPQLRISGTPIFFDVEGIPDREFYYLVGVRLQGDKGVMHHSLWADVAADEKRVWIAFLDILSGIENPVLIHYGSFETRFLKKMCDRYGGPPTDSAVARAIASSVNLLSLIFAQVYFPTYSNGLKEIARFLGFEWTDASSSSLQSIVWRHCWEASGDPMVREKLIAYNTDDCEALILVAHTLGRLAEPDSSGDESLGTASRIVRAESLATPLTSKWRIFKSPISDLEQINAAAHWNYQRDRVFIRSGIARKKETRQRPRLRRPLKSAEKVVVLKAPVSCPKCGRRWRRKAQLRSKTVQDLVFGRDSVKRRVVKYLVQTYHCRSCGREYGLHEWLRHGRKWGWNMLAYFVYHIVGLRVPQLTVQHTLNRLFGFTLVRSTLNNLKTNAADYYLVTKRKILDRIVHGNLIHADETRANIKGHLAYVWVLTNLKQVVYIITEGREGEIVQQLLINFKGVLVSDFYAAYDAIECPQQKCLIHLMRDLNDDILKNPFDEEMKSIAVGFAALLKPMVETIDRYGLKKHFLRKHLVEVDRFYEFLNKSDLKSEIASKCKLRLEKNRDKLFTFLRYDGVPWNNNNAEHAIKAFARLRDVISGTSTKKGVDEYLTLLSVAQTCEYQGLDFLNFLRSGEKDVETFAQSYRRYGRKANHSSVSAATSS